MSSSMLKRDLYRPSTPLGLQTNRHKRSRRIANRLAGLEIPRSHRRGGTMMRFNALVLITVGRRTGVERTNPSDWSPAQ
jgi:hypothetical protein